MTIKEVSSILGVSQHTIRYYEKVGIIDIKRREGSDIREFKKEDIEWIKYIITLKDIGFTLEEIKSYSILKKEDKTTLTERKNILAEHEKRVEQQIDHLKQIKKEIKDKISCIESREEQDED